MSPTPWPRGNVISLFRYDWTRDSVREIYGRPLLDLAGHDISGAPAVVKIIRSVLAAYMPRGKTAPQ